VFRVSGRAARRQRERDRDAATVDTFRDILAGQYMGEEAERAMWGEHYGQPGEPGWEGTAEDYAADMAAGPLMPLPPEVSPGSAEPNWSSGGPVLMPEAPTSVSPAEPGDPHDALSDEDEAEAYVGPVVPTERYEHLRAGQYAEAGAVATGFFAAALLDKYEAQQLLASYREREDAEVTQ
jgi:hypothetical protein